jgi:hypothetical protein
VFRVTPAAIVIFAVIWCIVCNAGHLHADVAVSPVITEVTAAGDSVTRGVWTVANTGTEPVSVTAEYEEGWLTITPAEFDIGPYGAERIEYAISPPPGHEGELSATVFFASDTGERFGVSIFAAIEDSIELACEIDNIKVKSRAKEGDILFIMDVKNTGNVHLRPEGRILIKAEDGSEYEVRIEKGFPVYPGTSLNYAIRWDEKGLPPGRYEAIILFDYGNIYGEDETLEETIGFALE